MSFKSVVKKSRFYQRYRIKKTHSDYKSSSRIVYQKKSKVKQLSEMMMNIKIEVNPNDTLQSWIDTNLYVYNTNKLLENMAPNYSSILNNSIEMLIKQNKGVGEIEVQNRELLLAVKEYICRVISELKKYDTKESRLSLKNFESMLNSEALDISDAIQRILFWSTLFWQCDHKLIGLGRLDKILEKFAPQDEKDPFCNDLICSMFKHLNKYYEYKSAQLLGDIGQIIVVGGLDDENSYYENTLTHIFINACKSVQLPDPKVLLRVSSKMPDKLLMEGLHCIESGCGSPLLSNDDVIVPALIELGYDKVDAFNYITSACWEPASYGNSISQNNIQTINYAFPFARILAKPELVNAKNIEDIIELYQGELTTEIERVLKSVKNVVWERDPLFTFFSTSCKEKDKDISEGGSKYNDYGICTVGLPNVVDSILIYNELVFKEKKYSAEQIYNIWNLAENADQKETLIDDLNKVSSKYFGSDDAYVKKVVDEILEFTKQKIGDFENHLHGKIKIGISSPAYVVAGERTPATFDGRKDSSALSVHISANYAAPLTEIINFAASIKYDHYMTNGNVIDYNLPPTIIKKNLNKVFSVIKSGISLGFYQMQLNVIDSNTLILAKENPERYRNLIVRVWGFSAYFVDLPEDYQDVLIKRVQLSEASF
ncbi:MAG: hypothetical protein J6H31_00930 [Butyrivibrio sp.]|nr:hypothetical protein [Butyrivibrio sp.]